MSISCIRKSANVTRLDLLADDELGSVFNQAPKTADLSPTVALRRNSDSNGRLCCRGCLQSGELCCLPSLVSTTFWGGCLGFSGPQTFTHCCSSTWASTTWSGEPWILLNMITWLCGWVSVVWGTMWFSLKSCHWGRRAWGVKRSWTSTPTCTVCAGQKDQGQHSFCWRWLLHPWDFLWGSRVIRKRKDPPDQAGQNNYSLINIEMKALK